MSRFITVNQAAFVSGKTERSVIRAIRAGKVVGIRGTEDRRYLVEMESLRTWMRSPKFYKPYRLAPPVVSSTQGPTAELAA